MTCDFLPGHDFIQASCSSLDSFETCSKFATVAAYVFRTRFKYRRLQIVRFMTLLWKKKKKTESAYYRRQNHRNQIRAHYLQTPRSVHDYPLERVRTPRVSSGERFVYNIIIIILLYYTRCTDAGSIENGPAVGKQTATR